MTSLNFYFKIFVSTSIFVLLTGCYYYQTPVSQYPDYSYYYPQPVQSAPQVSETTLQQQNFVHNHVNETTVNNAYAYNNAEQYNPYYHNPYAYYDPYAYYGPYASPQVATSVPPQQKPKKAAAKPSQSGASRVVPAKAAQTGARPAKPEKPQSTPQASGRQAPKPSSPAYGADASSTSGLEVAVAEPIVSPSQAATGAAEGLDEEEWGINQLEDEFKQAVTPETEPGAPGADASAGLVASSAASGGLSDVVSDTGVGAAVVEEIEKALPGPAAAGAVGGAIGAAVVADAELMPEPAMPTAARGLVSGTIAADVEPSPGPVVPTAVGGMVGEAVTAEPVPEPAAPTAARGLVSSAIAVASAPVMVSADDIRSVYNALRSGDQTAFEAAARQVAASLKNRGFNQSQSATPFPPTAFERLDATLTEQSRIIAEITKHF